MVEYQLQVLRDFELYEVILNSYDEKDETAAPYQVRNKATGVIEFQSFVAPAAYEMGYKFSQALINLTKEFDAALKGDGGENVVKFPNRVN